MKPFTAQRMYWILLTLSVVVSGSYHLWNSQRPSDEEVQRRMEEGLKAQQMLEEVRQMEAKFQADHERAFGKQPETNP